MKKTILPDAHPFLERIFEGLANKGIDVNDYELDHICYRVETLSEYESLKIELSKEGELLGENEINGRPIFVVKLDEPIVYPKGNKIKSDDLDGEGEKRLIYSVEVPAPKQNSPYSKGFEHVEFVIDTNLNAFKSQYPNIEFDEKGASKTLNPDLRLRLGQYSVKFHEQSLEYVIRFLD